MEEPGRDEEGRDEAGRAVRRELDASEPVAEGLSESAQGASRAAGSRIFERVGGGKHGVDRGTLEQVLALAVEIAREGREGRKIGTMFVVSDSAAVLGRSKCLILDPVFGHPSSMLHVSDPDLRETLKELAKLDGGFVISDDGFVLSAARYFDASSKDLDLPLGLGSRHMAGASMSKQTDAVAVVVSESSVVRVFDDGELISEIIPELWMLRHRNVLLREPYSVSSHEDVAVLSRAEGGASEDDPDE